MSNDSYSMPDMPNIPNLANSSVELTEEHLRRIGEMIKEGVTPLPPGAAMPDVRTTDPVVHQQKMDEAMAAARQAYGKITGSDTGDNRRT